MKYVSARTGRLTAFGLAALLALNACSSSKSAPSTGSSNTTVSNISGKVSSTSSSSLSKPTHFAKALRYFKVGTLGVSGCTIQALDLTTNAVVATVTGDSSGNYTLVGVEKGTTYKIVATCGSESFSSVATAVVSDTANISDSDRVSTDPRSTVIAAFIVQTILDSVETAVAAAPAGVQSIVKAAILASLDSVIQTITSTINAAIDSGAMAEPDTTTASNVTSALATATNSSSATVAVAAAPPPPAAVTQAVSGAKSTSVALQACNTDMGGTADSCTQAMAKLMYNTLGFPVGILLNGGAFGMPGTCTDATVVGSSTLGAIFPNAKFQSHADNSDVPAEYCAVQPLVAAPDRNRGYQNDGDNHGPVFTESGTAASPAIPVGVLTAMGQSIMSGNTYNLASIDKLIFDHTNGAGMNSRLISRQFTLGTGIGSNSFYYYNGTAWVNTGWINTCNSDGSGMGMGSSPCDPNRGLFDWGGDWSADNNTASAALATAIAAGSDTGLGILYHKFGGPIPAQNQIDSFIDEGRTHIDYNPSGEREMNLVTTKFPGFSASNPCWDNDPTTPCLDTDGNAIAALKVNLAMSGTTAAGVKKLTTLTQASDGAFYMRPYWGMSGFSGVIGFVKVADGLIARDELMRDRAVKIIFADSECSGDLPSPGTGSLDCHKDQVYNVSLDWSGCNGGPGGNCPAYSVLSTTPVTSPAFNVQQNYQTFSQPYCVAGNCFNHQLVARNGGMGGGSPYKFTIASVNTGAVDSLTFAGTGMAGASEYNLAVHYDCSGGPGTPCTPSGFFLVDNTGVPYAGDGNVADIGHPGGTWTGIEIYSSTDINSSAMADFDGSGGTDIDAAATSYSIASGPIRNPNFKCELEPFFVDGGSNGLDCEVSGGFSQVVASSNDRSFSSMDEYQRWLTDPSVSGSVLTARAALHLQPRDNAFQYGDPVGTKKLLSTAFNGWFDGKHSLDKDTSLNGLQVFALVYMFMSHGGDYIQLDDVITNQHDFRVMTPMFDGNGGNNVPLQNQAIGKAFNQFKTN